MPAHHIEAARAKGITIDEDPDLSKAVDFSDALYMTRLQQERFPDPIEFDHVKASYRLTAAMLDKAQDHMRVLHPLPRINEIALDVDSTKHASYFSQAGNGIPVRQALVELVLGNAR